MKYVHVDVGKAEGPIIGHAQLIIGFLDAWKGCVCNVCIFLNNRRIGYSH